MCTVVNQLRLSCSSFARLCVASVSRTNERKLQDRGHCLPSFLFLLAASRRCCTLEVEQDGRLPLRNITTHHSYRRTTCALTVDASAQARFPHLICRLSYHHPPLPAGGTTSRPLRTCLEVLDSALESGIQQPPPGYLATLRALLSAPHGGGRGGVGDDVQERCEDGRDGGVRVGSVFWCAGLRFALVEITRQSSSLVLAVWIANHQQYADWIYVW